MAKIERHLVPIHIAKGTYKFSADVFIPNENSNPDKSNNIELKFWILMKLF